jgi:diguanylate cyclase (GGDEF)-like protein
MLDEHEFFDANPAPMISIDPQRAILEANKKFQELALQNKKLKDIAIRDALTNLHNRRYLIEISEDVFHFHQREKNPLSVLMIDIDRFKHINDTYGHLEGDHVLENFAESMVSYFRKSDIICRYGGEEFTVIMCNTDIAQAYKAAESFRETTAQQREMVSITISIGIAELGGEDRTMQDLISRADKALYAAKRNGRNRVETMQ